MQYSIQNLCKLVIECKCQYENAEKFQHGNV